MGDMSVEQMCGAYFAKQTKYCQRGIWEDWTFMKGLGYGVKPGQDFYSYIYRAIMKADLANLRRLFKGFPGQVTSWVLGQAGRLDHLTRQWEEAKKAEINANNKS